MQDADPRKPLTAPPAVRDFLRVLGSAEDIRQLPSLPAPIASALAYWTQACGNAAAPRLDDIDLAALGPALAHTLLWDVRRPGPRFICRYAGDTLNALAGHDLRGMSLEAMHVDRAEMVRAEYVSVVETLKLHYVERYMKWTETSYRHYRRLLFPLRADDGHGVDALLCCQHYD